MSREIGVGPYLGLKTIEKKKRMKTLDEPKKKKKSKISDEITDNELKILKKTKLFQELKELRLKIAIEMDVPVFQVASDKALAAVVKNKPRTKEEMLQCYGIGKKRFEQIGDRVLQVVSKYL